MTKLNIMASRHSAFYSPMICTIAGGFLEKEGLTGEYHVVEAGGTSGGAVAEGRMDVAQAAVSASWSPLDKGTRPAFAHFARSSWKKFGLNAFVPAKLCVLWCVSRGKLPKKLKEPAAKQRF